MPDRPSDVKKKLDDLYRKTEDIRHNLIEIHHMLTNTGFFANPDRYQQPQPAFVPQQPVAPPPPPPPVVQQVTPPVTAPPPQVQQAYTPPVNTPPVAPQWKPSPQKPPAPPKEGFFERNPDLEKFIGERLVTFIGIAVLVTGIAFFVKYAIDKDWINEIGRTAIGILCGGILIGFAHRLRKSYTTFSSVLAGGGIAVLYFTISYAFQVYHLYRQPVALGLLVVVTLFTVLLSVAYDRKELAILAIVGGFASPLMIKTGEGNFVVLCTYMLILDAGMLVLAYYKKWNVVTVLAFLFTILFYTVALQKDIVVNQHAHDHEAFLFATLFYLVFFSMNIINNLKARRKFEAFEIISLLSNTGLYYGAGYFLLHHMGAQHFNGLFTLAVGVFNFVFAFGLFRRQEVDRNLVYFLLGIVITFVSLAGPVQLNGNHITLFWSAEAALLLWFYQKSKLTVVKSFSMLLNVVMVLSVLYNWMNVYVVDGTDLSLMINKGFITTLGAVASLAVSSFLLARSEEENISGAWKTKDYGGLLSVGAWVILFTGGILELSHQLSVAGYGFRAIVIYDSTYVLGFLFASWFVIRYIGMEFLRPAVRTIATATIGAALLIPHSATSGVRTQWLLGEGNSYGAFMMHYVHSAMLIAFGFVLLRHNFTNENITKGYRNFYLWLLAVVTVFTLSAELDHAMVMSYAYNPQNPAWRIEDVAGNISDALTMSHKVGFPIIWGICSFAMMAVGMRNKNRQLRIISLVLFSVTVVKLVLLGIYGESQTGKIIAFILCGVILLLVSFMYQKLKKIFMDDTQSNPGSTDEKSV